MTSRLSCRILGGLEVTFDGQPIALGGAKQQMVLARLLVDPTRVVSADQLVEWVWGLDAPESTAATLQVYVSNLRRALAPAATELGRQLIVTRRPGYVAELLTEELDASRFEEQLDLADRAARSGDVPARMEHLRAALDEWRGEPLAGLPLGADAVSVTTRLQRLHEGAVESLLEAELDAGHHREVLGQLEEHLRRQPLDERIRELHMLALYRAGRQADALASFQQARDLLLDELGLDPSPRLRQLEGQILAHDPALQPFAASGRPVDGARPVELEGSATVVRSSVLWVPARLQFDGRDVVLDRPVVTVGRAADRTVVLDDPGVSRHHAELRQEGQTWRIVDVGSSNGVVVNGERTGSATLRDGDQLRLGNVELVFRIGA